MRLAAHLLFVFAAMFCLALTTYAQGDWYKTPGTQPADTSKRAPRRPAALTNDDVLSMVEAGLSDEFIIRKIRGTRSDFDTSPDAISEIKTRGVSVAILEAMINASTPAPEIPATERADTPIGAKFYVAPMPEGFDGFISAEILKRRLPITVVADERQADFIVAGSMNKGIHKWYDTIFGSGYERDRNQGNIRVIRVKDRTVIWAGEAGDRSLWWGALKKGGQRKVADRLVGQMNSKLFKNRKI